MSGPPEPGGGQQSAQPPLPPPGWLPPPLSGGQPWQAQQLPWAPPGEAVQPYVPAGPPPRRVRPGTTVALAVGVLLLVAAAVAIWVWLGLANSAPSGTSPVPTAPVEVSGGDVGTAVQLQGPDGTATATVTAARWTPEGELPPVEGSSYLVVDVDLAGESGQVAVGGLFTVAVTADGQRAGISYGPVVDPLLASTVLRPGDTASGQLGYQLPPGPVTIEFQDPTGTVLGTASIPGP